MKKAFKIAGTVAGVAALIGLVPYSFYNKDRSGRITTYALLWKSTVEPDPADPAKRKITIDLGFHNPFKEDDLPDDEADLFEDGPAGSEDGISLTLEPDQSDLLPDTGGKELLVPNP